MVDTQGLAPGRRMSFQGFPEGKPWQPRMQGGPSAQSIASLHQTLLRRSPIGQRLRDSLDGAEGTPATGQPAGVAGSTVPVSPAPYVELEAVALECQARAEDRAEADEDDEPPPLRAVSSSGTEVSQASARESEASRASTTPAVRAARAAAQAELREQYAVPTELAYALVACGVTAQLLGDGLGLTHEELVEDVDAYLAGRGKPPLRAIERRVLQGMVRRASGESGTAASSAAAAVAEAKAEAAEAIARARAEAAAQVAIERERVTRDAAERAACEAEERRCEATTAPGGPRAGGSRGGGARAGGTRGGQQVGGGAAPPGGGGGRPGGR